MLLDALLQRRIPAQRVLLGLGVQRVLLDGALFHDVQHHVDGVAMLHFGVARHLDRAPRLHVLIARRLVLPHLQAERLQPCITFDGSRGSFGVQR